MTFFNGYEEMKNFHFQKNAFVMSHREVPGRGGCATGASRTDGTKDGILLLPSFLANNGTIKTSET